MDEISADIPLTLGIAAGALFVLLLAAAAIVTMRNRRNIRRNSTFEDETGEEDN